MIYRAKKDYFKAKIESENKDSKSLWQSLRDLVMPSKKVKTSTSTLGLKIDNEVSFDKATCAQKLNEFYTTVASKLVEKLHYANMSVQITAIFHGCKNGNFQMKKCEIFPIFAQNIDRGYTLEPPH